MESEKKLKLLPLGESTFRDIVNNNKLYVDKTEDIYRVLATQGKYFFLSRPRRFGKSLLISIFEEIFSGSQELFKGLYIYDKVIPGGSPGEEWKKYPIINIDFNALNYTHGSEGFERALTNKILSISDNYKVNIKGDSYKELFKNLIIELSKIDKVVILIDEYDKPIIEVIENTDSAKENRIILKSFYETIKSCDEYIKFAFLTGVSKFSKTSIFSSLNNLTDLTLDPRFPTIIGITEDELYINFDGHIKSLAKKLNKTEKQTKQELKRWYNGYSWNGENFVYNPFSILNVLTVQQMNNYWFESGTPTFLIKLIKDKNINVENLDNYIATRDLLSSFEVDNIKVESLLFQTGYLTIKRIDEYDIGDREYILNYPNVEVKESFIKNIIGDFLYDRDKEVLAGQLYRALKNNDLKLFFDKLKKIFTDIPNEIFMSDKERYYHTIIYLVLNLIGVRINVEISTNIGRIDAVIETQDNIYIFEFKMNYVNKAVKQIEEKRYYERYVLENKPIYLVGVSFDSEIRNIKDWKAELMIKE